MKKMLDEFKAKMQGVCATCDHLVQLNPTNLIGCEVRDKFILPEFPPFHGNCKCKDWVERKIITTPGE